MKELIFVYNAKSGLFNKATDFAHKIVSPQTYNCSLCSITYGNFSVHKEWSDFISSIGIPFKFFYKNDFEKLYPRVTTIYPAVYLRQGTKMEKILSASEIAKQKELQGLIQTVKDKLTNELENI
ncbi:MAG: hypothetical protein HY062_13635 [Bacteroidetes bacterium]|nr:hypothetical protein [Bacteroidota bacterium]